MTSFILSISSESYGDSVKLCSFATYFSKHFLKTLERLCCRTSTNDWFQTNHKESCCHLFCASKTIEAVINLIIYPIFYFFDPQRFLISRIFFVFCLSVFVQVVYYRIKITIFY